MSGHASSSLARESDLLAFQIAIGAQARVVTEVSQRVSARGRSRTVRRPTWRRTRTVPWELPTEAWCGHPRRTRSRCSARRRPRTARRARSRRSPASPTSRGRAAAATSSASPGRTGTARAGLLPCRTSFQPHARTWRPTAHPRRPRCTCSKLRRATGSRANSSSCLSGTAPSTALRRDHKHRPGRWNLDQPLSPVGIKSKGGGGSTLSRHRVRNNPCREALFLVRKAGAGWRSLRVSRLGVPLRPKGRGLLRVSLSHLALVCGKCSQNLLLLLLGHFEEVKRSPKFSRHFVELGGRDLQFAMGFFQAERSTAWFRTCILLGPPATLQTHRVRMNLSPGSLPRLLVCHSRRSGFSEFWPTIGLCTRASLKWSTTAAMANAPPSRSYRLNSVISCLQSILLGGHHALPATTPNRPGSDSILVGWIAHSHAGVS